ncbi:interaptin [Dorcoceras hygrometricum]|uniref:Interaptin n=1 Tax=Dorcoceras hygrometricum TaxID=472368 RepID=A0A2Z7A4X5_9LAMI|nr:interaptin [Dorcoceras hygrometricum]
MGTGIDQLALHSVQLGYLKILQMGNADPKDTKAGKEIRGQASLDQCIDWQIISIEPLYHARCINRGNNRSVIFRARQPITPRWYSDNQSVGHHSDDSVRLFRHDTSVGQSQRGSQSGHQSICQSGSRWIKVNWSEILFEVLKEMVNRTTRRAKGFIAQICILLKGDPAVTMGEAKTFPPLKILSEKTVNTYVAMNKTIDARGETDESDVAALAIVKKNSVSKKRPAAVSEALVAKKKRKSSGKAVFNEKDLSIVSVALDAEPIQTVDPTSVMPAANPPTPKRNAPKRKLRMTADSDDEFIEKESAAETAMVVQKAPTFADDVDTIIEDNYDNCIDGASGFRRISDSVRAQNAILSTDLEDVRQEVKDLKDGLSKDFDDKLVVIRNDLLEFRVETQGRLAFLGTNLAELIAFITKGSDDKKGEVSSSHGRGQPPDDHSRPSGGSESRIGGDGSSRRRYDRRGSSTKKGSSSGGGGSGTAGGPNKKNAEWWLYGKNQF